MQVAAVTVHHKVGKEVQRLQHVAQLARLEQSGGRTCSWRKEEEQTEARRLQSAHDQAAQEALKRELKIQPEVGSSWRCSKKVKIKVDKKCEADLPMGW